MNGFKSGQANREANGFKPATWKRLLALLLAVPLLLTAVDSEAAQIRFEPSSAAISAVPGDVVAVPLIATLTGGLTPNAFANFSLAQVGGNLNRAWINGQVYFSLNPMFLTRQAMLQVRVPDHVPSGLYTAIFNVVGVKSNEYIAPTSFVLNLQVGPLFSCTQPPEFSSITSTEEAIHARNHKQVAITLAGTLTTPEGCGIERAWYQLTDEYGELDQTGDLEIAADGAFQVDVPMVASCKGDDKDGRLYTVTFMAESEAGVGESAETRVVVMHDNRKQ